MIITMYNNSLIAYFTVVKKKSDVEAVKLVCVCVGMWVGGGIHMSSHYLYPVRTACTAK
jgi:hypothetical protein